MFFYPDPEPIGHCITDVSPSYLTDGVFFNGRNIGPTHKCVAKQLSAIPRGPETSDDPVATRTEVNPQTLENWTINSKAWYVDNCGRNAKALYAMMGLLPKEKVDLYAGWKSRVSIFPRSEQYEYSYIQDMRIRKSKNRVEEDPPKCSRVKVQEENRSVLTAPAFEYTKTPIWWRGKIPNRIECAVGIPDDYTFQGPDTTAAENLTIHKKQGRENYTGVYVPGVIYRREIQDKNEMQESMNIPDDHPVKVTITGEGEHPKDSGNCDCSLYYTQHKSLKLKTEDDDVKKGEVDPGVELDPRWNLRHGVCGITRNGKDRKNAMLNLYKPYHHEINTWYSMNKPTKLLPPLIFEGKRPILEWHFSNL